MQVNNFCCCNSASTTITSRCCFCCNCRTTCATAAIKTKKNKKCCRKITLQLLEHTTPTATYSSNFYFYFLFCNMCVDADVNVLEKGMKKKGIKKVKINKKKLFAANFSMWRKCKNYNYLQRVLATVKQPDPTNVYLNVAKCAFTKGSGWTGWMCQRRCMDSV